MADTGQSVINPGDCQRQRSLIMEVAADTTTSQSSTVSVSTLSESTEQCEVSSTTDVPNSSGVPVTSGGGGGSNCNKKQPQLAARAGGGGGGGNGGGGSGGVNKFHQFRAPQQCVQQKKKMWNKRQNKCHHLKNHHVQQQLQHQHQHQLQQQQQQQQSAVSKADLENIQNIKNQIGHHRLSVGVCVACGVEAANNNGQQAKNPKQQVYKKMLAHRTCNGGGGGCSACNGVGNGANGAPPLAHHPIFCSRTKFFLSDKIPRKEVIIPPTKFLLGGNISDPLNLNSLQNEANSSNNNTPATTPRQSPITTPPKVEVIIPPNIHDPLHLLDPVDTMEYEKQLTSPMKRKSKSSKSKHRNRKKKTKRKRLESINSTIEDSEMERYATVNSTLATDSMTSVYSVSDGGASTGALQQQHNSSIEFDDEAGDTSTNSEMNRSRESHIGEKAFDSVANAIATDANKVLPTALPVSVSGIAPNEELCNNSTANVPATGDRESVKKDLRLDLSGVAELQQQHFFNHHLHNKSSSICSSSGSVGSCGGRKRKISEGACSAKNKFRRLDSMDKIVSPVVPQPGAWKRPPRLVPTGARKNSRNRSTSVSETELLSPLDDSKTITDTDSIRADTPDIDSVSKHMMDTASIGSPQSTVSANTIDNTSINDKCSTTAPVQEAKSSNNNKLPKLRPDTAKYQFGNYDRYAGYRHLNEFMDVRLQVFQRHAELFQGKDILDIGCNVGHMTITVARNLAPKSILGIDIDKNLIARARKNLSMFVRIPKAKADAQVLQASGEQNEAQQMQKQEDGQAEEQAAISKKDNSTTSNSKRPNKRRKNNQNRIQQQHYNNHHHHHHYHHHHHGHHHFHYGYPMHHPHLLQNIESQNLFPVSFPLTYGGIPEVNRQLQSEIESSSSPPGSIFAEFPKNVFFRQTNYVLKEETLLNNDTQQYDLIVCLSVTKWIHLNFGDNGLKMAFKRMFNQLRPGGKLILEAQNWASYKKKKDLTETIYNNYKNIEFFPNKFHEYLLSNEVGFSHSYTLGVPRHMSKGFCRPIQLYAKGDFTPNHVRWSDAYNPQTPYEAYRGIYATMPRQLHPVPSAYDTPSCGGNSGSYSLRQTPMHQPTSQYYNPLETDSYLPSYDIEVLNQLYVFASPLYQTVWSPPASMRNSSSHTPLFGSVRDIENEESGGGSSFHRHVYPPNDETSSPNANGAFNSIRDADTDDSQTNSVVRHVYANCESSSSPHVNDSETQDGLEEAAVPQYRPTYEPNGGCGDSNES